MKKQEELYSFPQQNDGAMVETDIRKIPLSELHDFNGHPFKVENDMALFELMQSIEKEGVVVPALARPREDGGYELIAGHRRKAACKWAGLNCDGNLGPRWNGVGESHLANAFIDQWT